MDSSTILRTEVGTVLYRAPEVADSQYTCTVDCWSVGCIVFRLITGRDFFKNHYAVYKFKFIGAPSPVPALVHVGCGDDCSDFVGRLITADPDERLCTAAALDHPWMLPFSGTDNYNNRKYTITPNLRTKFDEASSSRTIGNLKDGEP